MYGNTNGSCAFCHVCNYGIFHMNILDWFPTKPFCNKRYDRAPHIGNGKCLPLCWRCLAIYSSVFIAYPLMRLFNIHIFFLYGFLFLIPCTVDGVAQYQYKIESTNARRIITGILAGIGFAILMLLLKNLFIATLL
jgi:uncharacterized membrane protein